ncbi:MAG: hypothetical protein IJ125_01565 [Atopobiaceae bacterium]|nr:hypothetical protein [Atopobiaceae bacterium]
MKRKSLPLVLALVAFVAACFVQLVSYSPEARAASSEVSLTVRLERAQTPLPHARFSMYRVGEFSESGEIQLIDELKGRLVISDVRQQKGWAQAAQQLSSWISELKLKAAAVDYTDENGEILFDHNDGVTRGFYLVVGDDVEYGEKTYSSLPFLITLPSWNPEDELLDYDVVASPKPGEKVNPTGDGQEDPTTLTPIPHVIGTPSQTNGTPSGSSSGSTNPVVDSRGGTRTPTTGELLVMWAPWFGLGMIALAIGLRMRNQRNS